MQYLPIFSDLKGKKVLVVGGGHIAQRKIELLHQAGAAIDVVAEQLSPTLQARQQAGEIQWVAQSFSPEQLATAVLVISATDDTALNQRVYQAAQAQHKLVNTVDDLAHCDFIFPSIVDRGAVQIAISSGGKAPVLARLWREKLERIIPQHLASMADVAGRWRSKVKQQLRSLTQRRLFWEGLLASDTFERFIQQNQEKEAEAYLAQYLAGQAQEVQGEVALVGAGPGDTELLTLKALQAIQQADVVLYDALIPEQILNLIRRDADKVSVGKRAGQISISQEQINHLLINHAQQGKRVVRLKGGDPFVFGRGGEELQALKQARIPFRVIPGVTAGVGATAYAGIPLTHREYAQSVTFITGHLQANGQAIQWRALAQSNTTLVVYMGTLKANDIQQQLLAAGRHPQTPVAVISQGTLPQQRTHVGTLQQLAELAHYAEKPALLVIGEVVKLQPQLQWFAPSSALTNEISEPEQKVA